MGSFLLIHGGQHGAWCWSRVAAALTERGHDVETPELPGRDGSEVGFEDFVPVASEHLDRLPEPAIVVAHSMGGGTAALLASRRRDRVRGVIFATAIVPRPGVSVIQGAYGPALGPIMGLLAELPPIRPIARYLFGGGVPPEDMRALLDRLNHENIPDLRRPFPDYRLDGIPCLYVLATADRMMPPRLQARYAARLPGGRAVSVASGHSIFLAAPRRLAEIAIDMLDATAAPGKDAGPGQASRAAP